MHSKPNKFIRMRDFQFFFVVPFKIYIVQHSTVIIFVLDDDDNRFSNNEHARHVCFRFCLFLFVVTAAVVGLDGFEV